MSFKSIIVRSPLEPIVRCARETTELFRVFRYPELAEIYLENRRVVEALKRVLKPDSNAIDAGAHIGSFSKLLLRLAPNGHHIAFEASPVRGASLASSFPEIEVHQAAVTNYNGSVFFSENEKQPGYSKISNKGIEVKCVTIDSVVSTKIDLIKLDIEGAEKAALEGAKNTIEKSQPFLLFECGTEYQADLDRTALYQLITGFGYSIYILADFLYDKGALSPDEFRKCGLYPFRAFNYIAKPN